MTIFLCIRPSSAWWRTTNQPGDPRASLPLTSEKAVFCNKNDKENQYDWAKFWGEETHQARKEAEEDDASCQVAHFYFDAYWIEL